MDEQRNTITITRGMIGQFAGFVGVGALLIGVLGWIWQGGISTPVGVALVISVVGIAVWIAIAPGEFVDLVTGRQARQGTIAVLSTLLFTGIVVMFYIFVERAVLTFDMTEAGDFTLTSESRRIIAQIDREIRITGFYSPRMVSTRELDDQFFRQYEVESEGLITRRYIDPVEQPALATTFRAQDGDVFISYLNPDGSIDRGSISYVPMEERQEREMTLAIARLLAAGDFTVYFDLGLGELDPDDMTTRGASIARELLQMNGFTVLPLNLVALAQSGSEIPRDASAIILARPQLELPHDIIELLDAYLQRGGRLFITTDFPSSFMSEDSLFNSYLWENWGIRMLDAVVVDVDASGATPLDVISAIIYDTPISAGIDPEYDIDTRTQFRIARAIEVNDDPPVTTGRAIMSSPQSYGETNLEALALTNDYGFDANEDIPGPLTLVAFAADGETGGRIVLVGDSDFMTDGQIGAPIGNGYLLLNAVGWLTEFTEQVQFAPTAGIAGSPFIFVDTATLDQIAFVTLILMPGITLLAGIGVWLRRSRR